MGYPLMTIGLEEGRIVVASTVLFVIGNNYVCVKIRGNHGFTLVGLFLLISNKNTATKQSRTRNSKMHYHEIMYVTNATRYNLVIFKCES